MQKKIIVRWAIYGTAGVLLLLLLVGKFGLINLYFSVYRPLAAQRAEVRQLRLIIDSLEREKSRLESDTAYIERIAREKLGMIRKGETVYKFVDEEKKK
jgi:cell division protein FtsB